MNNPTTLTDPTGLASYPPVYVPNRSQLGSLYDSCMQQGRNAQKCGLITWGGNYAEWANLPSSAQTASFFNIPVNLFSYVGIPL